MTDLLRSSAPALRPRSKRPRAARGQSVVEFALIVPVMLLFFVAIADMARLYATMLSVESAAREAADYGAFDSQYWNNPDQVRAQMTHRACLASSNLPGYAGTKDSSAATCTNPEVVSLELLPQPGSTSCTDQANPFPCWVKVTLEYDFRMILPIHLELGGGAEFGFPSQLTFQRTSTFAMTDLQLAPGP